AASVCVPIAGLAIGNVATPLTSGCVAAAPPSTANDTVPTGTAPADDTVTAAVPLADQVIGDAAIVVVVGAVAGGETGGASKTMNASTSVRVPVAAADFVASTCSMIVCVPGGSACTNMTRRVSEPLL